MERKLSDNICFPNQTGRNDVSELNNILKAITDCIQR